MDIPATSSAIHGTLVLREPGGNPTAFSSRIDIERYGANGGVLARRANGTQAAPTQVLANERFAFFTGGAYGTTAFGNPAAINFTASENQADNARGSHITFETTPIGAASRSERVRIKPGGQVRFIPLLLDPTDAEAGDVYYNSTSNKLKVYNGTAWVDLH